MAVRLETSSMVTPQMRSATAAPPVPAPPVPVVPPPPEPGDVLLWPPVPPEEEARPPEQPRRTARRRPAERARMDEPDHTPEGRGSSGSSRMTYLLASTSGAASPRLHGPWIWYGVPRSRFAAVLPRQAMYPL